MSQSQNPVDHLYTVRDCIRWGASLMNETGVFFGHGTDNAIDEAAALVLVALHLPPDLPAGYMGARLLPAERERVIAMVRRRVDERIPVPYLTHQAWFMGLPFYVDRRVLIPRSPMAELIERQFRPWLADPDTVHEILDLCTGSGCLGIACAHVFPEATADLADISEPALEVAERNVQDHGLMERVFTVHSDLFAGLEGRRYDLIVSNPPYVSGAEMEALPAEYRHEPELGLAAGPQGLDFAVRILREAADHLTENGLLVVEVGDSAPELAERFPDVPFAWVEFERGGDGVFVLTAEEVAAHRESFLRG